MFNNEPQNGCIPPHLQGVDLGHECCGDLNLQELFPVADLILCLLLRFTREQTLQEDQSEMNQTWPPTFALQGLEAEACERLHHHRHIFCCLRAIRWPPISRETMKYTQKNFFFTLRATLVCENRTARRQKRCSCAKAICGDENRSRATRLYECGAHTTRCGRQQSNQVRL
jgi:hypothetical protein